MYSTTLELLGLGLFFVVNLVYSALLGNDLFAFFGNSGMGPSSHWVKILAGLLLIALSMNFTSSVLTVMTLSNLQAKFGEKGEKLMLSPEHRKDLSSIEGMFVATIVLITVLSFRLYFSPTQMAEGMFRWVSDTIPTDYMKWGHMLISLVVLGLGLALAGIIDRRDVAEKEKNNIKMNKTHHEYLMKHPLLPEDFRTNFGNLFWVLMTIFLIYFAPMMLPFIGGFQGKTMEYMSTFFTQNSISSFTLFKLIFVPLTIAIAVESNKMANFGESVHDTSGDKSYPGYQSVIVLGITTMIFYLFTLLFNLTSAPFAWLFNIQIRDGVYKFVNGIDGALALSILFTLAGLEDTRKNIFEPPKNTTTDTPYIYHKILTSLLFLFPAVYVILAFFGMRLSPEGSPSGPSGEKSPGRFMYYISQLVNINNLFIWNLVDAFWVIRTFLLALAVVFAGLTINSFHKIEDLSIYHKYYHLKELFGSFIVFLMIVLPFSLFDTRSVARIMTLFIEYLAPIAVIIMMCLLVFYSNRLSKLSNKELIGGVSANDTEKGATEAEKNSMKLPNKDKVSRHVFNGVDTAI